jgi:serine/threonine protein phosphatase PrpC
MLAKTCYISHAGYVRSGNEDSLLVNGLLVCGADMKEPECTTLEAERLGCVAADGMGGHRKGEVASRVVLEVFKERYGEIESKDYVTFLMGLAKESLNQIAGVESGSFGLGTTLSGVMILREKAIVFNCGDSRVYRQKGGQLRRITKDHSIVQRLADEGLITEDEMRTNPQKNIITSAMVGDLRPDLPTFSVEEMGVDKGDRFFICTDGVWESMSHAAMEKCLQQDALEEGVRCLYRKVFEDGARDNLSMIAVEITEP